MIATTNTLPAKVETNHHSSVNPDNPNTPIEIEDLIDLISNYQNKIKDFSFIISHSIRSSASNLQMLSDAISREPTNLQFVRMLQDAALKLNKSVRDANEILMLESKQINYLGQKYNLTSALNKALKWNKILIESRGIKIHHSLPRMLNILGRKDYIDNILNQIISNAIIYGTNESSKKIFIDYLNEGNYTILRVRDFGKGMDLNNNFDKPFHIGTRLHKESWKSMGMGLFLVKSQLERMHGQIKLQSEPEKGTSVELKFLTK